MRIRFADPSCRRERAQHAALLAAIDALWRDAAELAEQSREARALQVLLSERAVAIDPRLCIELRSTESLDIIVSSAGERRLRPLVDLVVERAPALSGVRVRALRPPGSFESALERVRTATGIALDTARARAGFTRGHLLEVVVYAEAFAEVDESSAREGAELAVEVLLGERTVDDWVAAIDFVRSPRRSSLRVLQPAQDAAPTFELCELSSAVQRALDGVRAGLPELPFYAGSASGDWTMFETTPKAADDWPAQDDLLMATTMLPELLKSFLEGAPFASERFSRHHESFCYLKFEDSAAAPRERLERRSELEDKLNAELIENKLGCVIGNGFGLRYSYIDLALVDLERALGRVIELAKDFGMPEKSWLLFCDTTLAEEWLPLASGAPPPPGYGAVE